MGINICFNDSYIFLHSPHEFAFNLCNDESELHVDAAASLDNKTKTLFTRVHNSAAGEIRCCMLLRYDCGKSPF